MIVVKLISIIACLLSNWFGNCSANECRSQDWAYDGRIINFNDDAVPFSNFERCANEIEPNGNVTEVFIYSESDVFMTKLFAAFPSLKSLSFFPSDLTQQDFLGANHLESLTLWKGHLNLSSSLFVNAPKLKTLRIKKSRVVHIDPEVFKGASALRTLTLHLNSEAIWPEELFDGLTNLQVIDLLRFVETERNIVHNIIDLETVRIPADNNIKMLIFSRGNITELKAEPFVNFKQLTMLLLGHNKIGRIRPNTFVGMNQLILLDLTRNNIEELTPAMLTGLTNLRTVYLARNRLRYIESGTFSSTPQLRRLDLSYNGMLTLEPHTFTSLPKLNHLDLRLFKAYDDGSTLEHNDSTLDFNVFCNVPNLSLLNLQSRGISKLKKCTPSGNSEQAEINLTSEEIPVNATLIAELLSEWEYLDFNINPAFGGKTVRGLAYIDGTEHKNIPVFLNESRYVSVGGSRLDVLILRSNRISDWEDNLFENFVYLKGLDLDDNPIESLRSGQFNGLGNLLVLTLYDCKLTALDLNAFSPLTNLKKLDLTFNPITTISPPEMPMHRLVDLYLTGSRLRDQSLDKEALRRLNWMIH